MNGNQQNASELLKKYITLLQCQKEFNSIDSKQKLGVYLTILCLSDSTFENKYKRIFEELILDDDYLNLITKDCEIKQNEINLEKEFGELAVSPNFCGDSGDLMKYEETDTFKDSLKFFNTPKKEQSSFDSIEADFSSTGQDSTQHSPNQTITANSFLTAKEIMKTSNSKNPKDSHFVKKQPQKRFKGFVSPLITKDNLQKDVKRTSISHVKSKLITKNATEDAEIEEGLKNIEPRMVEMIKNEIMHNALNITWEDIAGLEHAKKCIEEIVVWPMLRPDIFTGLRGPPKGLLLFGPPGTGKTLIGKCIASQSKATFFSISSSSLTSKWIGEGEKMVRALFAVARCYQPAVVFVDEIDSLLTQRSENEVEATRRIKTEFLIQFDGCGTTEEHDRILIVGATNRPQEIDEAARRRFRKRLYIPLPMAQGRKTIIKNLLKRQKNCLSDHDIDEICNLTEGYSGSDMDGLCREAALGPIRSIKDIRNISADEVRSINIGDFRKALDQVRASVSDKDLGLYEEWNNTYGSLGVK